MYQYGPHLGRGKNNKQPKKTQGKFSTIRTWIQWELDEKKKKKKENKRKERQRNRQNLLLPTGAVLFGIIFIPFAIVIILRIANNWETYTFQYRQVDERGQGPLTRIKALQLFQVSLSRAWQSYPWAEFWTHDLHEHEDTCNTFLKFVTSRKVKSTVDQVKSRKLPKLRENESDWPNHYYF